MVTNNYNLVQLQCIFVINANTGFTINAYIVYGHSISSTEVEHVVLSCNMVKDRHRIVSGLVLSVVQVNKS